MGGWSGPKAAVESCGRRETLGKSVNEDSRGIKLAERSLLIDRRNMAGDKGHGQRIEPIFGAGHKTVELA